MPNMDWEQLEALKRQLEEDYRMDIAAIERLQRRFKAASGSAAVMPAAPVPVVHNVSVMETPAPAPPKPEPTNQAEPDELTTSLRSMFSTYRK